MRFTVDIEEKTIDVYNYDKQKYKYYLTALEKIYSPKGFTINFKAVDYNTLPDPQVLTYIASPSTVVAGTF